MTYLSDLEVKSMAMAKRDDEGFWAYIGMASWGIIVFIATVLSLLF